MFKKSDNMKYAFYTERSLNKKFSIFVISTHSQCQECKCFVFSFHFTRLIAKKMCSLAMHKIKKFQLYKYLYK